MKQGVRFGGGIVPKPNAGRIDEENMNNLR